MPHTRATPVSVSGVSSDYSYPGWISLTKFRPMDARDIREFRRWHVDAAKSAGFDVLYIYAGMGFGPYQFLLPWMNKRTDEYGGSLENRVRLMREIIEEMKEATHDSCGIALRFSSDALLKIPGEHMESEAHEIVSMLGDVPDLWDIKSSSWTGETASARFAELGGRVTIEAQLPNLSTWARVRDYRTNLIKTMSNADGFPVEKFDGNVFTPDEGLSGVDVKGPVVTYDFDHYYMGNCLAEVLRRRGNDVTIVTPANAVSAWTFMNNELNDIRNRMFDLDICIELEKRITGFNNGAVQLSSVYRSGKASEIDCESLVVAGHECARTIDAGGKDPVIRVERPSLSLNI